MIKFIKKYFFSLPAITLALVLLLTIAPSPAHAESDWLDYFADAVGGGFSWFTDGLIWFSEAFGYAIAFLTAQLVAFAAYFIQIMIGLSTTIIGSLLVTTGFKIVLQITNIGFVLAVIFIAFATIFRLQGYEFKKLIKNLVIAAFLVNFSFTIAGLIMDSSHIFANFFIDAIIGGRGGNAEVFTANIANSLNAQKLNLTTAPAGSEGATLAITYVKTLASIAISIIYNSAIVITFFAVAGMMVIRYIALSVLLIVMPIAWLCWIFPGLKKNWDEWWHNFLKWNLFLPVLMFFIYIALLTSSEVGGAIKAASETMVTAQKAGDFTTFGINGMIAIGQGIVQIGILFGGLIIAQKMGIAGADGIVSTATAVKDWTQGKVKKYSGYSGVDYLGQKIRGRQADKTGKPGEEGPKKGLVPGWAYGAGAKITGAIGLGGVSDRLSAAKLTQDARYKAAQSKAVNDRVDQIKKDYPGESLVANANLAKSKDDLQAFGKALLESGKLDDVRGDTKEKIVQAVKGSGLEKEFTAKRPELAMQFGMDKVEFADKMAGLNKEKLKNIDSSSFANEHVWNALADDGKDWVLKNRPDAINKLILQAERRLVEMGAGAEPPENILKMMATDTTGVYSSMDTLIRNEGVRKRIRKINFEKAGGYESGQKALIATLAEHFEAAAAPKKDKGAMVQKPMTEKERAEWANIEERNRQKEAERLAQQFPGKKSSRRGSIKPLPGTEKPPSEENINRGEN